MGNPIGVRRDFDALENQRLTPARNSPAALSRRFSSASKSRRTPIGFPMHQALTYNPRKCHYILQISIIITLEVELGVKIADDDLSPAIFASVPTLTSFVERKM